MSVGTRKRADAVRNREAVLEAAIRLLGERPDASMRDIVRESGERMNAAAAAGGGAATVLRRIAGDLVELGVRFRFLEHHRDLRDERLANPEEGENEPYERWFGEAQASGGLRPDQPVDWMLTMLRGMTIAAIDDIIAGRVERDACAQRLGETFVAAFGAEKA
jgi:hypothetical protein